jgi:hypothetical protein
VRADGNALSPWSGLGGVSGCCNGRPAHSGVFIVPQFGGEEMSFALLGGDSVSPNVDCAGSCVLLVVEHVRDSCEGFVVAVFCLGSDVLVGVRTVVDVNFEVVCLGTAFNRINVVDDGPHAG